MEFDRNIIDKIEEFYETKAKVKGSRKELQKTIKDVLAEERLFEQIDLLSRFIGKIEGEKLLEIGSGCGMFVALSRKRGVESYGVEPDEKAYNISQEILDHYGLDREFIKMGNGENLPFDDESFDIVFSAYVLEHVNNPEQVLLESIRVLKNGGYLHFVIPNYQSFWEGHYGILWFPNMSHFLAKIYLSLLGRDPNYINEIQLLNPRIIRKILDKIPHIQVINWGIDIWEERMSNLNFSGWASLEKLRFPLKILHKLRLVGLIKMLGRKLEFYYPIILTLKKM